MLAFMGLTRRSGEIPFSTVFSTGVEIWGRKPKELVGYEHLPAAAARECSTIRNL
jgi:hypothetical protein